MTEADWLCGDDALHMLAFLGLRASPRKHRLHLCGGCRQIWNLLYADGSRGAVEVGERFADGEATERDLKDADWHAEPATWMQFLDEPKLRFFGPDQELADGVSRLFAMGILTEEAYRSGAGRIEPADPEGLRRVRVAAQIAECCVFRSVVSHDWIDRQLPRLLSQVTWPGGALIRDLFGNPFRPVPFDPQWRTADVIGLARAIYDDRAFDRLPILSDALLDVGCDDEAMIAHCRSSGPHVRGCWVLDLILGKE